MTKLPSILCGSEAEVAIRAGAAADAINNGERLAEAAPSDIEPPELVVLQWGSPLISDIDAYRANAIHERLGTRKEEAFEQSLALLWGVLALLGQDTQLWLLPDHRHRPFLAAVLEHADEIAALDGRFTIGLTTGSALWDLPNNVRFVLAREGVPIQSLVDPDPPGGWPELVRKCLSDAGS